MLNITILRTSAGPYAMRVTLQHFFDSSWVNFRSFGGWMVSLSNVINALAAALYLMFVVRLARSPSLIAQCMLPQHM